MDKAPSRSGSKANMKQEEEEKTPQTAQATPSLEMKIDTSIFKEHIKQKYIAMISGIGTDDPNSKILVIDPPIYAILRNILIKDEIGVSKIMDLKEDLKADAPHIIFMSTPSVQNMNKINTVIQANMGKSFHMIFVPRRTFACKEVLLSSGRYGDINNIFDFNFDLIPMDTDLLSLEINDAARQLYLELDTTTLVLVAESIQRLQLVFGKIDCIFGKGLSAKVITDMLKNLESESKLKPDDSVKGEIDCCLILDRNLDFATPMLTQNTYAGLLDENWGIRQNNLIMLDKKFFPFTQPQALKLNKDGQQDYKLASDRIFREIKDYHLQVVRGVLDEKLAEIKNIHDEAAAISGKDKSVREIREKYEKERKLREKDMDKVATHAELRNTIDEQMAKPAHYRRIKTEQNIVDGFSKLQETLDFVETQIAKQADLAKTLRLLCLQSIVEGGIKQVALDGIKREFIQAYGFQHILTLNNLEKAGVLKKDGEKKIWDVLNKQLKLINPEIGDLKDPTDATFAYEGYAPILVRLIEFLFKKDGWNTIKSSLDALNAPTIYDEKKGNAFSNTTQRNVILVYIIGGVTYGELSAIRYIGKKYNKEIIVATTGVITGDRLVSSFFEKYS